ncbi:hypothetical protein AX15_002631 [Amanita polypyramis BW_CC]|nr:hypothetical protein AX15_002631 [Amanita polypyramis BW_CC]
MQVQANFVPVIGATEAGLFPGVIYVFSVYYRRNERSWRVAIFFGGAALAGAFGGIFAYAIGKMDGVGGKIGWQWIFILEGLITVVVSVLPILSCRHGLFSHGVRKSTSFEPT